MKKQEAYIVLIAVLAAVAKLYCALTTTGTMDVICFREFGHYISDHDVIAIYKWTPMFNHTPLVGTVASLIYDLTSSRIGWFPFCIRLPGIIADFASVLALLWLRRRVGRPNWWALGLFAASPVALMISGFHGNVDSILALLLLLTALACVAGEPALCGLFLGLACQVKILPLMVSPIFFFYWWHRGQTRRFFTIASATILLGWAWPLITIPTVFLHNVLDYNSIWGTWGVSALLRLSGAPGMSGVRMGPTGFWISEVLKLVVVAGVFVLAWRRRRGEPLSIFTTLSLAFLVFFVFAPGFCVEYLIWFAPFLILQSEHWYAVITAASSVALFVFYNVVSGGMPWDKGFEAVRTVPQWAPWLLLPWLAMTACLIATRSQWHLNRDRRTETGRQREAGSAMKEALL
jgi:uncharacterized membrane protein